MQKTFINLPQAIEKSIDAILAEQKKSSWIASAESLHDRYLDRDKDSGSSYLESPEDALAYLALRLPATYAQVVSALSAIAEVVPSWKPQTILDIGSGPGTGVMAAQTIWSSLSTATCLDADRDLLRLGERIFRDAELPMQVIWQREDIRKKLKEEGSYDIVLFANVLNELSPAEVDRQIDAAYKLCRGVLIIVEPGTSYGNTLIESVARKFADTKSLIAPYIGGSFVPSEDYWIHFSQRFIRPEFQRRLRQHMRESTLMASDWEDTKYCYVAISKIPSETQAWGRCIGPVKKQKGFFEVPILTKDTILQSKVLKRNKEQYNFTKDISWGDLIGDEEDILSKE